MCINSLFETVTNFCHSRYVSGDCEDCDHACKCPGSPCGNCKQCLEEIHYPNKHPNGRKDYNCSRMMDFYVCDYTAKYASEILYLMRKSSAMKDIDDYHILSIGCGACPDLMALEQYCHEQSDIKSVSYIGIDVNERWKPIHDVIKSYKTTTIQSTKFCYRDAVTDMFTVSNANVIVLQYVISHFYNNSQIRMINKFFQKLIDTIVSRKQNGVPMVILINDVNSCYRGRDYFSGLVDKLRESKFQGSCCKYYFDYMIKHESQRYGIRHESNITLFDLPERFEETYQPWHFCSSAQLLIEVH